MEIPAPDLVRRTQLVAHLHGRVDVVSKRLISILWERVPGYEEPTVRLAELNAAVIANLHAVLDHLLGPETAQPDDEQRSYDIGVARAIQGITIDSMILSFRTAERLFADELIKRSGQHDTEGLRQDLLLLARGFDWLQFHSIRGFRDTEEQVAAQHERLSRDLVSLLLLGDGDARSVAHQASVLGLSSDAEYQALAFSGGSAGVEETVRMRRQILAAIGRMANRRTLTATIKGCDLVLVPGPLHTSTLDAVGKIIAEATATDAYVAVGAPAATLASVGRSARQALSALQAAQRRGLAQSVCSYDDMLLDILAAADPDAAQRLHELYYAPLAGQSHLEETLIAHLETNLSIRRTAERLFVHPNTIVYRLGRIQTLTGFDPREASSLVSLVLAIRTRLAEPGTPVAVSERPPHPRGGE